MSSIMLIGDFLFYKILPNLFIISFLCSVIECAYLFNVSTEFL